MCWYLWQVDVSIDTVWREFRRSSREGKVMFFGGGYVIRSTDSKKLWLARVGEEAQVRRSGGN